MKQIYFVIGIIFFAFSSCLKEEYALVKPQLKLIVKDSQEEFVKGATVKLYDSQETFINDFESIELGLTDSLGTIVFIELEEIVYYFKIEKDGLNNVESNFFFKEPLAMGERKVIKTSIK